MPVFRVDPVQFISYKHCAMVTLVPSATLYIAGAYLRHLFSRLPPTDLSDEWKSISRFRSTSTASAMAPGSWGVDLWDQCDAVFRHSSDQVTSTDMLLRLLSEVQKLQHDFGKKLRKTVTSYVPKKKAVPEETTYNTSLANIIQSFGNVGAMYEKGSKDLADHVIGGLKELYDNERKLFDTHRSAHSRLNSTLDQSRKQLDVAWQKYVFAYKEKQKAFDNSIRADNDMQLPRAEQLKARKAYTDKSRLFDQVQGQYAEELSKYNSNLRQHYNKGVVQLLEDIQLKAQDRTDRTKELLIKMCDIRDDLSKQLMETNRVAREAILVMDPLKDNELLIKRHKSGEIPPVDLPFLDLARCQPALFDGPIQSMGAYLLGIDPSQSCSQLSASGINSTGSTTGAGSGGMLGGLKLGKGAKEEYANLKTPFVCDISTRGVKESDLTVLQLTERLRDLADCVQKANAEIQGTQRLMDAYRNNPALGSSKAVEPKIDVLKQRIQSLQDLIKQLEDRYSKVGGDQALSEARTKQTMLQGGQVDTVPRTPAQVDNFDSDNSFDSDLDEAVPSKTPVSPNKVPAPPSLASVHEPGSAPYVGLATAKYEYAGSGSSYLATRPGERFHVVQLDTDNTGWTSVISEDGSRQGFVPTSFMDITTY
ncbi:Formin-binding protein 1-like [Clonorchis sinensis]|uniref:Formin-binding protein 1-like n=1 Tax=Clonorchis sinensis TaxID=79923 RepID=A0A419PID9_CLOSI|nr:Formin-binding protein 1-like [Clonorchis sinensis]